MSFEIRALRESEIDEHAELIFKSYHTPGDPVHPDDDLRLWWRTSTRSDNSWTPELTRVLVMDGRLVSSVTNFLRYIYMPGGRLAKSSAIGSVATHPDYRGRGLLRHLMAECVQWMESEQFIFSFLFGKYEVYNSSGFEMLTAYETVATNWPPAIKTGLTVRQAHWEQDLPVLIKLHQAYCPTVCGPVVRSEFYWRKWMTGGYFTDRSPEFRIIEDAGTPVAYFRKCNEHVPEFAWATHDTGLQKRIIGTILNEYAQCPEVRFSQATPEFIKALKSTLYHNDPESYWAEPSAFRQFEQHKGLWRYIGPGHGEFPEFNDTTSMLAYLRSVNYTYFYGADSF